VKTAPQLSETAIFAAITER